MIDKPSLLTLLETSGGTFVDSFRTLDQSQFHFKPGPDRWSIAEIAEHVIVAETGSGRLLGGRLTREPTPPEVLAQSVGAEARIDARLGLEAPRVPAPEFVLPKGRWQTPAEMVTVFTESRQATIRLLATSELDFRAYAFPHAVLGPLDGLQWAYFMARHALRHADQIETIKRLPAFPPLSA
jgi:hypothetical protein